MTNPAEEPAVGNDGASEAFLALRGATSIVPVRSPDARTLGGYMRLVSHILLQSRQHPFRTLGVISANQGEGKTTTALNLAACLGRTLGHAGRVLLVDGDIRGRTLSRQLGGEASPVPEGRANGDSRSNGAGGRPHLRLTDFLGVDLMTAPGPAPDFSLPSPELWTRLLTAFGERYSLLVVDCPSVLDRPDGLVLPACVDRVVLVVRAGATTKHEVAEALQAVDREPLGVVLNVVKVA